jgi:hypothetical protein
MPTHRGSSVYNSIPEIAKKHRTNRVYCLPSGLIGFRAGKRYHWYSFDCQASGYIKTGDTRTKHRGASTLVLR